MVFTCRWSCSLFCDGAVLIQWDRLRRTNLQQHQMSHTHKTEICVCACVCVRVCVQGAVMAWRWDMTGKSDSVPTLEQSFWEVNEMPSCLPYYRSLRITTVSAQEIDCDVKGTLEVWEHLWPTHLSWIRWDDKIINTRSTTHLLLLKLSTIFYNLPQEVKFPRFVNEICLIYYSDRFKYISVYIMSVLSKCTVCPLYFVLYSCRKITRFAYIVKYKCRFTYMTLYS